jgi:hypothetical protein
MPWIVTAFANFTELAIIRLVLHMLKAWTGDISLADICEETRPRSTIFHSKAIIGDTIEKTIWLQVQCHSIPPKRSE